MEKKEKSVLEKLFSKKELEELNFSEEEIEAIEDAEAICEVADHLPANEKALEKILDKIDSTFPNDNEQILLKLKEVSEKDPKFFDEIVMLGYLFDQVEQVPPPETNKVSLEDIANVTAAVAAEDKNAKLAAILDALKEEKK